MRRNIAVVLVIATAILAIVGFNRMLAPVEGEIGFGVEKVEAQTPHPHKITVKSANRSKDYPWSIDFLTSEGVLVIDMDNIIVRLDEVSGGTFITYNSREPRIRIGRHPMSERFYVGGGVLYVSTQTNYNSWIAYITTNKDSKALSNAPREVYPPKN